MGRVHRHFYPSAKAGEDPNHVRPIARAEPVVDRDGVHIVFLSDATALSPSDLVAFARWCYSLSHQAQELAKRGLITEEQGHNVETGKPVVSQSR